MMESTNPTAKTVIDYYVLCQTLKSLIRTGWKNWQVQGERLESVAEHVYGTQMLAIAMHSEYHYALDLQKIILMLAIHELEETVIGDLTLFQISKEEKQERAHKAIAEILAPLANGDALEALILEFDGRQTPEARFAFFCDKLECDLQARLYDEEGRVDLSVQEETPDIDDAYVRQLLQAGLSWSEMWIAFSENRYHYDAAFQEVADYASSHRIRP